MGQRPTDKNGGSEAEEVAAYVATMAVELKGLVVPHKMQSLSYLLELVRLEAEQRARGGGHAGPDGDS
jgi:hypothetical protein